MRLKGKIALITGSSRGIGRSIALAFAKEGTRVVICYLSHKNEAMKVARRVGQKAIVVQLDVRDRESIKKAVAQVKKKFGPGIDILVNNAGINIPNDFDKISDKDWRDVMTTNLDGVFKTSQELLPLIKKGGRIINIASISGQIGGPRTTHYAASKAAVIALTENLALFCAKKNILVNAISPGFIKSPMLAKAVKEGKLPILEKIPLGRLGTYEEVAKVAVFLASDDASYITAQVINVNGGLYF